MEKTYVLQRFCEFHLLSLTPASLSITSISSSAFAGVAPNCVYTPGILVAVVSPSCALIDI